MMESDEIKLSVSLSVGSVHMVFPLKSIKTSLFLSLYIIPVSEQVTLSGTFTFRSCRTGLLTR